MTEDSNKMPQLGTKKIEASSVHDGSNVGLHENTAIKNQGSLDTKLVVSDFSSDSPIKKIADDKLGLEALSESIAKCILTIPSPNGNVVAINGPWGAGKSSLVNLVIEDVKNLGNENLRPIVIRFNSWLYRTEEGVINGFFQEFRSRLKATLEEKGIDIGSLVPLIEQIASVTSIIRPGLDLAFPSVVGAILEKASGAVSSAIKENSDETKSVEDLRRNLSKELKDLDKHILIVIDDIDRLSPEEALAVFRLIKSVGRLENVIYLLAYDRDVAERMIKKIYPSERKIYLEKIVQANFDLPELTNLSIISILEERFKSIFGATVLENSEHIYNTINSIVIPEIKTPRDIHRLANIISVIYPSVKDHVDIADFIAIETFRLFRPNLYKEIRSRKRLLTEISGSVSDTDVENIQGNIEDLFLSKEPAYERLRLKHSLVGIFPSLNPIYHHSKNDRAVYLNENRRIFSSLSFETYFRFSISRDEISEAELVEFVQDISEAYVVDMTVSSKIREYAQETTDDGQTRASLLLDRLAYSKDLIGDIDLKSFLVALYKQSKLLDIPSDSRVVFGHREDNYSRIKKLSRNILIERYEISRISDIMLAACVGAPLKFRVSLCSSMCSHYGLGKHKEYQDWVFLTIRDAKLLKTIVEMELNSYVKEKSISDIGDLPFFLADWVNIVDKQDNAKTAFKHVLEEGTSNAVRAANEFIFLFPDASKDNNPEKKQLIFVSDIVDVEHFVIHLNKVLDYSGATDDDKNSARRLIKILGHIDAMPSLSQSK